MYKSILQFNESGTIRLDNICADFFENPKDVASFVNGVKDEMLRFACEFIGDAFEELNGLIKSSSSRKDSWEIVRNDQKSILTSDGLLCKLKSYKNLTLPTNYTFVALEQAIW